MTVDPAVLLFDCRFSYGSSFELDADFTMEPGTAAVRGPSGSGKTTILALIAGLLRPKHGSIRLHGRTLVDVEGGVFLAPEQRGVAVVFQEDRLFPHLNVRRNLLYGKSRRPARDVSFERVVEVLELTDLLDRRPATLSGGQARRVALGRALLRGPSLLMLDEPLTGLDDALKERVLVFLERILEEWQLPTLVVTHDSPSLERLADEIIELEAGRVK
jgi:molybdate transport system ATP-binding protein